MKTIIRATFPAWGETPERRETVAVIDHSIPRFRWSIEDVVRHHVGKGHQVTTEEVEG